MIPESCQFDVWMGHNHDFPPCLEGQGFSYQSPSNDFCMKHVIFDWVIFSALDSSGVLLCRRPRCPWTMQGRVKTPSWWLQSKVDGADNLWPSRDVGLFGNTGYSICPLCIVLFNEVKMSAFDLQIGCRIILWPSQTMWYGCSGLPVASKQNDACQNLRRRRRFAMESVG